MSKFILPGNPVILKPRELKVRDQQLYSGTYVDHLKETLTKKNSCDTYAIRCSKCYKVFGSLAHLYLYKERICNHCCPTAKFSDVPVGEEPEFLGCECSKSEEYALSMIPGGDPYATEKAGK